MRYNQIKNRKIQKYTRKHFEDGIRKYDSCETIGPSFRIYSKKTPFVHGEFSFNKFEKNQLWQEQEKSLAVFNQNALVLAIRFVHLIHP